MCASKILPTAGLLSVVLIGTGLLGACNPAPGSKAWCEKMAKTDKMTWSVEDARTYAEKCVVEPAGEKLKDMEGDVPQ